jgi:nitroimidazol reductase NimA-like FMN-containing flavoprotein (pyridoxamine 5'-phosphate oxidase superfamily)
MSATTPSETTNLDIYGDDTLPWSRPLDEMVAAMPAKDIPAFLATVGADGRPHSAGIGPAWYDGAAYFTSSPKARKARNLAVNPACTLSMRLDTVDVVLEGRAERVSDPDTLETLARMYRDNGWPAEVADGAFTAPFSAPSAGPPPWHLYRLTVEVAFGVAIQEPYGATRWTFPEGRA